MINGGFRKMAEVARREVDAAADVRFCDDLGDADRRLHHGGLGDLAIRYG